MQTCDNISKLILHCKWSTVYIEPQFKGTASHNFVKYTMLVNMEPINTITYLANHLTEALFWESQNGSPGWVQDIASQHKQSCAYFAGGQQFFFCHQQRLFCLTRSVFLAYVGNYTNFSSFCGSFQTHINPFLCFLLDFGVCKQAAHIFQRNNNS